MTQSPTPDFRSALVALAGALKSIGRPAMLIGGLAVVARGVPRLTIDIDAVVDAEGLDVDRLWEVLRDSGFEARVIEAAKLARERLVLLLRHPASGVTVDLSLGWMQFERDAIERATTVDLGGVPVPVATPEDLVVLKAVAWRRVDKLDMTELIVRHHAEMDLQRMRRTVAGFYELLEVPERVTEFDQLVSQALDEA
ncbi:MAG: nucleotidyltransferase [Vicinamibacterales bacterium]